jgi:hypothetical protein
MTHQEQVCTLEQAEKLKELECEQGKSIFYWFNGHIYARSPLGYTSDDCIDAYTVAELGVMLAELGETEIDTVYENGEWTMAKGIETIPSLVKYIWHPTEAQARAALLIHILEQKKNSNCI